MPWSTFLKAHRDAIAAADLFTVEVYSSAGLIRHPVFFVIDPPTRRGEIAANRQTFDRPDVPHFGMASQDGADTVYQRIVEIVNAQLTVAGDLDGYGAVGITDFLMLPADWTA